MTVLFTGPIAVPAGITETAAFPVPDGVHSARASMLADPVPLGTEVTVLFSFDGGASFPAGAFSTRPLGFFPRDLLHVWELTYTNAIAPTHVKVRIDAPSLFSSTLTVESL